jgi:hypothetical protein
MADEPNPETKALKRPITPRNATRLSMWSAAGATLVLLAGMQAYNSGWSAVASPGPVVSVHAAIDATCAQCHGTNSADDLRCERCHDPLDSRHWTTAAHVLVGGGGAWTASHTEPMPCASCHVEHRGRGQVGELKLVDDRKCEVCHGFGDFDEHPEFTLLRSGAKSELGLQLSHAGHLEALSGSGDDRCLVCHEPTEDKKTFQPILFERHCARCHLKSDQLIVNVKAGEAATTGSVASALLEPFEKNLVVSEAQFAELKEFSTPKETTGPALSGTDSRGRRIIVGFAHQDRWILERLDRLSAVIDPQSARTAARQGQLSRAIASAEATARVGAVAGLTADDLDRWAEELRADLAALDRQRAAAHGDLPAESRTNLTELARALAPNDPVLAQSISAATTPAPVPAAPSDEARKSQLEADRAILRQLLDAIDQRGDEADKKVVAELRRRTDALAVAAPAADSGAGALLDRLDALERAFAVVEKQAGATAAADLRAGAELARQRIAGGIGGAAFGARRDELLTLLESLKARADVVDSRRIADLEAAVSQLGSGDHGDASLATRLADKRRLLERVLIQRDLAAEPQGPTDRTIRSERAALRTQISLLRAELSELTLAPTSLPPLLSVDAAAARRGVNAILQTCVICHKLNADQSGLAPIRRGLGQLQQLDQANFSHKEHTGQAGCESCHTKAGASRAGDDINVPNVASCQTCHKPGGQGRTACASCHTFHSRTGATLGVARR